MNITVSESAQAKITDILAEENNPDLKLRMFVQGGGCSGFSYGFTLDEMKNEDDWEVAAGTTTILVDSMSAQYLEGAEVDFKDDLMGSSFSIKNPQATSTWGKMLTREELLALLARLDAKKKEREMSKLSDTLARALAKKQGKTHLENDEAPVVEEKVKGKPSAGPAKKPPTRSAGRGR